MFASSAAQSFGRVQCEVITPYPPAQSPPCPRKRVERTVLDLLLIEFPEIMTNEVVERVCELPIKEVGGAEFACYYLRRSEYFSQSIFFASEYMLTRRWSRRRQVLGIFGVRMERLVYKQLSIKGELANQRTAAEEKWQ